MTVNQLMEAFETVLPQDRWSWVAAALQYDPEIWEALQGELAPRAAALLAQADQGCPLAALGLMAWDNPDPLQAIQNGQFPAANSLNPDSSTLGSSDPGTAWLAQCMRLALELQERSASQEGWEGLSKDLESAPAAVLACLTGLLPNPAELIAYLLSHHQAERALQAVLCNPMPDSWHAAILHNAITAARPANIIPVLSVLALRRPELLAVLETSLPKLPKQADQISDDPLTFPAVQLERLFQSITTLRLTGHPERAYSLLQQTTQGLRRLQARWLAELAAAAAHSGNHAVSLNAWRQAVDLLPECAEYAGCLAIELIQSGREEEAQAELNERPIPESAAAISYCLAQAILAAAGGSSQAGREFIHRAVLTPGADQDTPRLLAAPRWMELARLALSMGMAHDGLKSANRAEEYLPQGAETLNLHAQAALAAGEPELGITKSRLARLLQPHNPEHIRCLAKSLEAGGRWVDALQVRSEMMGMVENPDVSDWHDLASCALHAGDVEQSMRISQRILEKQANDAQAHVTMGQSLAARGDNQLALEHLERATQLAPGRAEPWLALAALYQQQGLGYKALDTLRAAAHTAPELYEIQLALGETYLTENAPTQALAALRTAGRLLSESVIGDVPSSTSIRIELRLGQTLLQLGHLEEARSALQRAYQANPGNHETALGYAQALLALGDPQAAFEPLRQALSQIPGDGSRNDLYSARNVLYSATCLAFGECVLQLGAEAGVESLEAARLYLEKLLETEPKNAKATVLLAEILAAQSEYAAAMQAFQNILESELTKDLHWKFRMNLGLGKAALQLGMAETAIAALQEAAQVDALNAEVQRQLCLACQAASLHQDAYQAARTALALAATELDTLVWFAEISLQLIDYLGSIQPQVLREAISALQRAVQLAPQRSDLWLQLGELQLRSGERNAASSAETAAQSTLHHLVTLENPQPGDLYRAAQTLKTLGDFNGAAACLERALQGGKPVQSKGLTQENFSLIDLLVDLADARQQAGSHEQALSAIQQALLVDPTNTGLYTRRAGLLLVLADVSEAGSEERQEHIDQAIQALEKAVEIQPQDAALLLRVAALQRAAGNLPEALAHSLSAAQANPAPSEALAACLLAAEIQQALLLPQKALQTLDQFLPQSDQVATSQLTTYHCLRGELALLAGDVEKATQSLVQGMEYHPDDPRLLALQSRLTAHRLPADWSLFHASDTVPQEKPTWMQAAGEMFATALDALNEDPRQLPAGLPGGGLQALRLALVEAALELQQWEPALDLARQVQTLAPHEPYAQLLVARLLTLRAEAQRLFQQLEAQRRAPGLQALSTAAWNEFQQAIQAADELTRRAFGLQPKATTYTNLSPDEILAQQSINRWQARGSSTFHPQPEHTQALAALSPNPEDAAALIACLGESGDLAMSAAVGRQFPSHPLVLAQLALALAQEKPRQALAAAQSALEGMLNRKEGAAKGASISYLLHLDMLPLLYALLARLYWSFGHRLGDRRMAAQSIQAALDFWPDEPRWHALAADIYLALDQAGEEDHTSKAIEHLEQALRLDPHQAEFARRLGQIQLERGRPSEAVPALERACQLAPEDPQAWMLLASAHQARGEGEQAAIRAERASLLAPDWIEPLLLRSELALAAGNLAEAQTHAQAVITIDPLQPKALMIITRALQAAGKSVEALEALDKALEQTGSVPLPLRLEKARLLHDAHGARAALLALDELKQEYPQDAALLALQAEYLNDAGETEAAARAAQQALHSFAQEDSASSDQLFQLHFLVGRLLGQAGQLDQAIQHLSEATRLRPENIEPLLELGQVHLGRRQYSHAQRTFQQAIQACPQDARGYYHAALAMKEGRDYLQAEHLLRKASDLAPKDLNIRRLLGAIVALNLVHNRRAVGQDAASTSPHTRGG